MRGVGGEEEEAKRRLKEGEGGVAGLRESMAECESHCYVAVAEC